ncbi:uncharacterized protein BJ212DRAFT_1326306 [Suillus subaureus]|uniref:Uncharacterized protein n=1 Tax=Suillus subaureus TaxID=48587 RepID=A0A9P7EJJ8_9AGAM|nr:uncharacterized protein BJ212DRAFT_1326306 [Suillus subaureus]KAG1823734.1 hypothetical protein BJ212DRAFT_1326306 [Suillus subaureus]
MLTLIFSVVLLTIVISFIVPARVSKMILNSLYDSLYSERTSDIIFLSRLHNENLGISIVGPQHMAHLQMAPFPGTGLL